MWFGTLIYKNIIRRPIRSALTIVAIAIAIGAVVSLVGIASGFENTFRDVYERKGVDLFVVRAGQNKLSSALPEDLADRIRKLPGVVDVIAGLVDVVSLRDLGVNSVVLQGWIPDTAVFDHLTPIKGRLLHTSDQKAVILGSVLARNTGKDVGDTLEIIEGESFQVVGIYETHNVFENGAMVVPLHQLQEVLAKRGQVTGLSIILDKQRKDSDPDFIPELRERIKGMEKNLSVMSTQDHIASMNELRVVKAMAWLTSTIALAIGLFGVMNTMVMAVNERTREIGILRAVGWRPRRVLRLVLLESVALSLLGAVLGVVGAVVFVHLLTRLPTVAGLIDSHIQPIFFLYGFVIATLVGLVGGILPARRAANLLPTAALRQE
jgi:putative ABC transport system permease protein